MGRDRSPAAVLGIEPASEPLTHKILGARLYLHAVVRLGSSVLLVAGAWVGREVVGIADLDVRAFAVLAGLIFSYNLVVILLLRRSRPPGTAALPYRQLQRLMHLTIALDFLALTAAVWLMGGVQSPFLAFYLLHVILAAVLLSPREAAVSTIVAYALLAGLVIGEWAGVIPVRHLATLTGEDPITTQYAAMLLVVYGLLFAASSYMLVTLSGALHRGEAQMQAALAALERISSLRRDFLHIVVHNMGSPVGAVTMLLTNLRQGLAGPLTDKQAGWVDRAVSRLEGLTRFLGDLRVLATLESGRLDEEMSRVDVAAVLSELVEEYRDLADQRSQTIELETQGAPVVRGNERLLREAIVNYVTNAIRYGPEGGVILVRGVRMGGTVRVSVTDEGPGIADEDRSRLFAEFKRLARAREEEDVPRGTGLGLSIVRRVAELHGGSVGLDSRPGEGSCFYLDLPAE